MRLAFASAIDALPRVVASTPGSTTDWPRVVKSAVRDLTSAQRLEIASANELTFQRALDRAIQRIGASIMDFHTSLIVAEMGRRARAQGMAIG